MNTTIPELDRHGLRQFGLTMAGIIAGLFGLAFPLLLGVPWALWPWVIAGVFTLWSLLLPQTLNPVYYGWMRFGLFMGRIMNPLILGIVFFLLFVPMGWAMRLLASDPMRRRLEPNAPSYRVPSRPLPPRGMEKPF